MPINLNRRQVLRGGVGRLHRHPPAMMVRLNETVSGLEFRQTPFARQTGREIS